MKSASKLGIAAVSLFLGVALCIYLGVTRLPFDGFHILWSGGVVLVRDVSEDREAWFGYEHKVVYETLRDLFLIRTDWGLDPERLALTPEGELEQTVDLYIAPRTVEAYEKDPRGATERTFRGRRYTIDVAGVVRAGTRLRCDRLLLNTAYTRYYGRQIDFTLYATILGGPFDGTLVDVDDISTICDAGSPGCRPRDTRGRLRRGPDDRIVKKVGRFP